MSNSWNDTIRERAREASESCTNSLYAHQLDRAIEADDLDLMRLLTHEVEQYLFYFNTVNDEVGDIF